MPIVHFNTAFKGMTREKIELWIKLNKRKLVGSAIFSRNDSLVSKLVQWAEKLHEESNKFVPSHVGGIVEYEGKLYVIDMIPPMCKSTPLVDYLLNSKSDYAVVIRDFRLSGKMFSKNLIEYNGTLYPFLSAIRSVFTKRESKLKKHCSELVLREYQKQNLFKNVNPEITPLELWNLMTNKL